MSDSPLSHAGRHLMRRRDFLRLGGTGLGGIALAAVLHEQRALGSGAPIVPQYALDRPHAPRAPHFSGDCEEETLLMEGSRLVRLVCRVWPGRLQRRWCPRCGREGFARPVLRSSAPEPAPETRTTTRSVAAA